MDHSIAGRSQLFSLDSLNWDDTLCELFNVDLSCLPSLVPTLHDFGKVKIDKNNIPLLCVIGDQQAARHRRRGEAERPHEGDVITLCEDVDVIINRPFAMKAEGAFGQEAEAEHDNQRANKAGQKQQEDRSRGEEAGLAQPQADRLQSGGLRQRWRW